MRTEELHHRFNAIYFTFGAVSFVALLGSLWWGGWSFIFATPVNAALVLLGFAYIALAGISVRHSVRPIEWLGCGGKDKAKLGRVLALMLPIPIAGFFLYETLVRLTFDGSQQSFENVKTQFQLERALFGYVRAEGITWHFARNAFRHHNDDMGDRISYLVLSSKKEREGFRPEIAAFLTKLAAYHLRNGHVLQAEVDLCVAGEFFGKQKSKARQFCLSCVEDMKGNHSEENCSNYSELLRIR